MNLYGEPKSFGKGILVHPNDAYRVDEDKWDGILIPIDNHERNTVTFCRFKWIDVDDVIISDDDPLKVDIALGLKVMGTGATATIGQDGALTFDIEIKLKP